MTDDLILSVGFEKVEGCISCTIRIEQRGRLNSTAFLRDPDDKCSKYPPNLWHLTKSFAFSKKETMYQWIDRVINQVWADYVTYIESLDVVPESYKVRISPDKGVKPSIQKH